jgi:hypothetical protein
MGAIMTTLLADAGLEKANHTVTVIGQKLTDTQCAVGDLRNKIASLALLAAVDPDHEPELIDLRQQLAQAESSMRELGAAEQLAKQLAREAREKALRESARADWASAVRALDEALVTAAAAEDVLRQFGDLYQRLRSELHTAAGFVTQHLKRDEHKGMVQPPNLDDVVKQVLSGSSGLPGIVDAIRNHSQRVLRFRPADTAEQEVADHGD